MNSRALKPQAAAIDAYEVRRNAHRPEQKGDTRDALEFVRRSAPRPLSLVVHVPSPAIGDLRARHHSLPRRHTATARSRHKQRAPRGSLRTDAHWQRLRAGDVVPEELCAPSLCGTEPGCRAGSRARPKFRRKRVRAARRGQTKWSRAWVRSSRSPRSRSLPMAAALRLPSTRRVTAGWSQALFNQASVTLHHQVRIG